MKRPETGGQWVDRKGAITEVRIVMRGVGHGYEFSVLNHTEDVPDDLRHFERPGMTVLNWEVMLHGLRS